MNCLKCGMDTNSALHTPAFCQTRYANQRIAGGDMIMMPANFKMPKVEMPDVVSVEEIEVTVAKSRKPETGLSEHTPDNVSCFMCGTTGKHTQAECDATRAADMLARPDHYAPPSTEQQAIWAREDRENEAWEAHCESIRDAEDDKDAA